MANEFERKDRIPTDSEEDVTLNQDGTRLGGGGGAVANPTAAPATRDLPIGGSTGSQAEMGQRREELPGIAGGASSSDRGVSGWVGSDPSGVGRAEEAALSGQAPPLTPDTQQMRNTPEPLHHEDRSSQ